MRLPGPYTLRVTALQDIRGQGLGVSTQIYAAYERHMQGICPLQDQWTGFVY